jgi:hypothetical protein
MLSDDRALRQEGETIWQAASLGKTITLDQIRQSIDPWNNVGLLSAAGRNRLAHTAAAK